MPIRESQTYTFNLFGLTDATDGSNAAPGALAICQNLVPAPNNPSMFAPRPAATLAIDLHTINPNGIISAMLVVGYTVYGMISSATYAGYDEPFAYNLATSTLLTINGVAAGTLPATIPNSGDWVPPVLFSGTGSRIMLTHSGFVGGAGPYLGWLDVSGFTSTSYSTATTGNLTNGSPVIRSLVTPVGVSAPILSNYQPGQAISGTGIPANTYIKSCTNGTFSLATTGTSTSGSTAVTAVVSLTGVEIGNLVTGPNIAAGTFVAALPGGGAVTLSQNAIGTGAGALTFTGGGTITMTKNATATNSSVALTIAGGTLTAPLWGSGNLNTNPLTTVPICGAAFNGRAWYGVGNAVVYSDTTNATQVTQASQALIIGDLAAVTALVPLPLTSQLTGGVQQSLTAYKGAEGFWQITGDGALGTLALSSVSGSVGTLAPNTITQTPMGVAMICVDGLRFTGLTGTQSNRVGADGDGISVPFLNAIYPSRMTADYAENVYRVTVTSAADPLNAPYEYWYDLTKEQWSGPHTFPARLINSHPAGGGFLIVPLNVPCSVYYSDVIPKATSTYTENGVPLTWSLSTPLLPDNQQLNWNTVVETRVTLASPSSQPVAAAAYNEAGTQLGQGIIQTDNSANAVPLWGSVTWGAFEWGAQTLTLRRYPINWAAPLAFRQAKLSLTGKSIGGQLLGSVFIRYQVNNFGVDPVGG